MFEFKRALPEETGISSAAILRLLKRLREKSVPMHALLIMKDDKLIFEKYYAPYKAQTLHRMFSISKSFSAAAIFLLAMEGKLSLEDGICDYFPEYVSGDTHEYIKMMTIRNLLEMRTCHASTTYKVDMKSNWVESFFTVPPTHKPGTVFHYDTSAAHTLCALAEKLSGKEMLEYMKERMLKYVDFSEESYMIKDPFGVSMGGSGLMATPMDILKFLYILDKRGHICCSDGQVRDLLPKDLVEAAVSNISDSLVTGPLPSESQGYGMQIWQNEKGGFVLYGMGGQLAISIPSSGLLIMTCADTQGMQGGNQVIYDALYENLLSEEGGCQDKGTSSYEELMAFADALSIEPPRLPAGYQASFPSFDPGIIPVFVRGLACGADSGESGAVELKYRLSDNRPGFSALLLHLSEKKECFMEFTRGDESFRIPFGLNRMQEGVFPIYGTTCTSGGIFTRENVLYVRSHLVGESVGSVHFQIFFEREEISVFMKKIEETYFQEFDGHLQGALI